MLGTLLHVGTEHPNLLWVLVPSVISFGAGVALGMYSQSNRQSTETETVETVNE